VSEAVGGRQGEGGGGGVVPGRRRRRADDAPFSSFDELWKLAKRDSMQAAAGRSEAAPGRRAVRSDESILEANE
jgi:hypothetical protein